MIKPTGSGTFTPSTIPPVSTGIEERFSKDLCAAPQGLPNSAVQSNQGSLVRLEALSPFVDGLSRCIEQENTVRDVQYFAGLKDYLSLVDKMPEAQRGRLMIRAHQNGEQFSCTSMRQEKTSDNNVRVQGNRSVYDGLGNYYGRDDQISSCEPYHDFALQVSRQLQRQPRGGHAAPGLAPGAKAESNADYAKRQRATGMAIAGHGCLDKECPTFVLPDNVVLRTYRVQGQAMDDRTGINIEAGHYEVEKNNTFQRTYRGGNFVPNYHIDPPDKRINVLPGSITVPRRAYLSTVISVLSENAKRDGDTAIVDLSVCQNYVLPNFFLQPKDNIIARLDIFDRDFAMAENEYGAAMPEPVRQHLREFVGGIVLDATVAELYSPKRSSRFRLINGRNMAARIDQAQARITRMDGHCYKGSISA